MVNIATLQSGQPFTPYLNSVVTIHRDVPHFGIDFRGAEWIQWSGLWDLGPYRYDPGDWAMVPAKEVTQMLIAGSQGHREALDQLLPLVYNELRRLARHYLRRQPPNHTLQATALVHEAYLRLIDQKDLPWQNRAHFFGIAAHAMRCILVEHARGHQAAKRGGGVRPLSLEVAAGLFAERQLDLVALDEALRSLTALDPQKSRIVELRFFGGLNIEETAEVLKISPRTVNREWTMAKAWLRREIRREG